jgi:uncharacterized CHY-type Zn-finger protein
MPLPRPEVRGIDLDAQTRCAHYGTALDIIAIRMKCCGVYYACKECHEILAGHPIEVWPEAEWSQAAVLCGACGCELSIAQYMASGHMCPRCGAAFNSGCRNHYQFYFADPVSANAATAVSPQVFTGAKTVCVVFPQEKPL